MTLTREQILARKTGRGKVELDDGSVIAIRALTRDEVLVMQEECKTLAAKDNFIIATGMTDPQLSIEDVAAWAAAGDAGDLVVVSKAIAVLSKIEEGAGKSGVPGARKRPRA